MKPKDKLIRQHCFECPQHTDNAQPFLFATTQSYILHIRTVLRRKESSLKLNLSEAEVMLLLVGKDFKEYVAVALSFFCWRCPFSSVVPGSNLFHSSVTSNILCCFLPAQRLCPISSGGDLTLFLQYFVILQEKCSSVRELCIKPSAFGKLANKKCHQVSP